MGTRVYKIPPSQKAPEGQTISPGHKMLKKNDAAYDSRVFGGKTGFTSLAGNTLVTYAKKDDMTLIAVILNGHQTHYTDTKKLLDFGFSRFQSMKLTDYEGSLVPENHLTYSCLLYTSGRERGKVETAEGTLPEAGRAFRPNEPSG